MTLVRAALPGANSATGTGSLFQATCVGDATQTKGSFRITSTGCSSTRVTMARSIFPSAIAFVREREGSHISSTVTRGCSAENCSSTGGNKKAA
ncbi:hypothetical protein D3C78_1012150 [compost metagenome]